MFAAIALIVRLAVSVAASGFDVPAPAWSGSSRASNFSERASVSAVVVDQHHPGGGPGGGPGFGPGPMGFSGPGMIVGGAVLTGTGVAILAAGSGAVAPGSSQWQNEDSSHQAANGMGLVLVVTGAVMMGWGFMMAVSDR
jgi:hypothetical protein